MQSRATQSRTGEVSPKIQALYVLALSGRLELLDSVINIKPTAFYKCFPELDFIIGYRGDFVDFVRFYRKYRIKHGFNTMERAINDQKQAT